MRQSWNQLRQSAAVKTINAFLRKPIYIIFLAMVSALGSVFALDLVTYTVMIVVAVYLCLLGEDLLPLIPVAILCYISPSWGNNPGRNPESIFYPQHGGIYLIVLASVFLCSLIFRMTMDKEIGGKAFFKAERKLLGGMLVLGAGYLLSGIGLAEYGSLAGKNLLFAFLQFVAVTGMYYLFTGTVKWENAPKNYLAWTGVCVGFVVMAQLLENYCSGRLFEYADGVLTINRYNIATGWGMHNNVGGLMAAMVPFCFYLACREKRGWIFNLLAIVLMVGVVMSFSRSSMLMGGLAFALCAAILLTRFDKGRKNLVIYGVAAAAAVLAVVIFREKIMDLLSKFISEDLFQVNSRDDLIVKGLTQFKNNPIFGGSFFPRVYVWDWSDVDAFSSFFPPRWHNTIIQVLASCGVVGMAAYAFHRFQTVKLLCTQRSREKLFVAVYLGVLLGTSLLDCHFFNVGPTMVYSIVLAFAEKIELSKE